MVEVEGEPALPRTDYMRGDTDDGRRLADGEAFTADRVEGQGTHSYLFNPRSVGFISVIRSNP